MSATSPMFSAERIAHETGGTLRDARHGSRTFTGINSIDDAGETELAFAHDRPHADRWYESKAGGLLVSRAVANAVVDRERPIIEVENAENACIKVLELFVVPEDLLNPGIDPSAKVDSTAVIGKRVRIGPDVWIGPHAHIGDSTVIYPGARLYGHVVVGAGVTIHANVVIRQGCRIGDHVILHSGVSIGADGFGYRPRPDGKGLAKVPHIGTVVVESDVEIGANTCIDRGKFGATVIGAGTKIDNLVQIGHNCRIGRCCLIAGNCGIAGSVTLGDGVILGGGAGIADNLKIGPGARIGANSGVTKDIPAGETWLGYPAGPATGVLRQWVAIRRLSDSSPAVRSE